MISAEVQAPTGAIVVCDRSARRAAAKIARIPRQPLGELMAHRRRQVRLSVLEDTVAQVAAERGIPVEMIRGPLADKGQAGSRARAEVWRRLCGPNVSIASVARAWPCDHTSICTALNGGRGRKQC